jgi:membrane carboxypeptidase/penicillin-binding protein
MTNVFDNRLAININTTGAAIANKLAHKYAGKSGSTNSDNWMIGYNKDIVLGIWTGYDDNTYIENSEVKFIKYIWADIVENYMKQRTDEGWYDTPVNVVGVELNPTTGMIAHSNEYSKKL